MTSPELALTDLSRTGGGYPSQTSLRLSYIPRRTAEVAAFGLAAAQKWLSLETVKRPTKVTIWGMTSFRGLTDLHNVPSGKTISSDFHVEEVLKEAEAEAMSHQTNNGSPTAAKLLRGMSQATF